MSIDPINFHDLMPDGFDNDSVDIEQNHNDLASEHDSDSDFHEGDHYTRHSDYGHDDNDLNHRELDDSDGYLSHSNYDSGIHHDNIGSESDGSHDESCGYDQNDIDSHRISFHSAHTVNHYHHIVKPQKADYINDYGDSSSDNGSGYSGSCTDSDGDGYCDSGSGGDGGCDSGSGGCGDD